MAWFKFSARSPIGIDVGVRRIKAVQLERIGSDWHVYAAASIPRTDVQPLIGQQELARFVGLLDRQGFSGRRVVLAVPNELLIEGTLNLPPRGPGVPLEKIAQMELARMHKCEPDSFKMACWDLPASARDTGAAQVMAAGCARKTADPLLDRFEAVGLDVVALDTAAWSLARACRPLFNHEAKVIGILDLGWTSARLAVLVDGVIIYERSVSEGGIGSLHASLIDRTGLAENVVFHLIEESGLTGSRKTDLPSNVDMSSTIESYLDLLVQLIQGAFSYASHRYRDADGAKLLLVGGGAQVAGLHQRLDGEVNFEVARAAMGQLVDCPSNLIPDDHAMATTLALGLCQHGQGVVA